MLFILFRHFRQAAGIVETISEYIYIVLSIQNIVKHCLHVGHSTQQQSTAQEHLMRSPETHIKTSNWWEWTNEQYGEWELREL